MFVVIIYQIAKENLTISVESCVEKHRNALGICLRFLGETVFFRFKKSIERAVVKARQLRNDIFRNVYVFYFLLIRAGKCREN